MKNEIVLTPEELEELKDEIKFRANVLLRLKQLNGIPQIVGKLQVWTSIQWVIIIIIIGVILGGMR